MQSKDLTLRNPSAFLYFFLKSRWILTNKFSIQLALFMAEPLPISPEDHEAYMRLALTLAQKSTPKPTNFCVGAVLLDKTSNHILSTGYTLELPGNTHAEQCCLEKFSELKGVLADEVGSVLPENTALYTTMEPCNKRSIGNLPCTEMILKTHSPGSGGIKIIYVGVAEPETFIGENKGRARLEQAGITFIHVPGFEDEILKVATAGHHH